MLQLSKARRRAAKQTLERKKEMIKGRITKKTSFDTERTYTKDIECGDLEDFMIAESEYVEEIGRIFEKHGQSGESVVITYHIELKKEKKN